MKKFIILALITFVFSNLSLAQEYQPTAENLENREWFQDAKFGMFIHWGVYSVLGVHEWVMETQSIDKKTYEKYLRFSTLPSLMRKNGCSWPNQQA